MSFTKRMMEKKEEQYNAALQIAISAGTLQRCEYHADCVFDAGADDQGTYRLGNNKFSSGSLSAVFENRKMMTDCIQTVIREHCGDECPSCAKFMAD